MEPPGLALVEDVVRRERDVQERHVDAADTRAGLLLGFAGLVVSLVEIGTPALVTAARVCAGLAGLAALSGLSIDARARREVDSVAARLHTDPLGTRLALLRADVAAHRVLRARGTTKVARVRLASRLLTLALALALVAATVGGAG